MHDGGMARARTGSSFMRATRGIKQLQKIVAHAFQLPLQSVDIVSPYVGGAFGSKGFQWSHTLLAAAAARNSLGVRFASCLPEHRCSIPPVNAPKPNRS